MASRILDVTNPKHTEHWETVMGKNYESYKNVTFSNQQLFPMSIYHTAQGTPLIQGQLDIQPLALGNDKATNFQYEKEWHPVWTYLPILAFSHTIHQHAVRRDVVNFIHPALRLASKPIAAAAIACHVINTASMTHLAGYGEVTTAYESAATLTWQALNNYALPATIFKLATTIAPRSAAAAYGSALVGVVSALAFGSTTKNAVEKYFLNRRWHRKEYGNGGQDFLSISIHHDNFIDYLENPGNVGTYETPGPLLENFPGFMTAEVAPVWEVPYNSADIATLQPNYIQGAYLENHLSTAQGDALHIPAPTFASYNRLSDRYGDWSIASIPQHQLDRDLGLDFETVSKKSDKDVLAHVRQQRRRHQVIERIFKQQLAIANTQKPQVE